jgi:hypothetical protein
MHVISGIKAIESACITMQQSVSQLIFNFSNLRLFATRALRAGLGSHVV